MIARPTLLMLTASVAALAAIVNGVEAASPPEPQQTRLGNAISEEIGARDQAAARRSRALDLREQAARAMETRLKADMQARQQAEAGAAPAPSAQEEDQFENLARIYQAMKPGKAAAVFEQLDLDVQMRVAQRMRERSTALILAAMTPKAAATLSMALARRAPGKPTPAPRRTASVR